MLSYTDQSVHDTIPLQALQGLLSTTDVPDFHPVVHYFGEMLRREHT